MFMLLYILGQHDLAISTKVGHIEIVTDVKCKV